MANQSPCNSGFFFNHMVAAVSARHGLYSGTLLP